MSDAATTGSTPTDPGAAAPAAPTDATTVLTDGTQTTATEQQTQQTDATNEAKPADGDKPAEGEKPEDDKPQGAPEEYAEFTLPDGVEFDAELGGDLKTFAKEQNLSQEQAQKLADLGAKQLQKFQAAQADAVAQAREAWQSEARADKEYGGDKFDESLASAKKAVDAFATPELKTLLNQTGLGNHPELIRFMVRAGKAISEDRFDGGRGVTTSTTQSTAQRLYGNTTSKT